MSFFLSMVNLVIFISGSVLYVYQSCLSGVLPAVMFTTKLTLSLFFLIVIRGAVPRYRYDFLTKLGWVKFLLLILVIFLNIFFISMLW